MASFPYSLCLGRDPDFEKVVSKGKGFGVKKNKNKKESWLVGFTRLLNSCCRHRLDLGLQFTYLFTEVFWVVGHPNKRLAAVLSSSFSESLILRINVVLQLNVVHSIDSTRATAFTEENGEFECLRNDYFNYFALDLT